MARTALVALAVLAIASFSYAQVPDHLKCYKVKDPAAKAEYTADLGGLAPEPGCIIKTPAKMLCVASTKANVTPPPPGAAGGPAAGRFVCYAVKCPKGALPAVPIVDQFGTRDLQPSKPKLLCAPVAPPSTTTTTTTTTVTATSSTTTLMKAQGEPCTGAAECVTGFCVDGYCCGTACSGSCMACDMPGSVGVCSNVLFQDPPRHGTCPACGLCNASGACCSTVQCTPPNGACTF